MTRYTRRHYHDTVLVIGKVHAISVQISNEVYNRVSMLTMVNIETWTQVFKMDNPNFDPDRFVLACLEACNIDPNKVPRTYLPNAVRRVLSDG